MTADANTERGTSSGESAAVQCSTCRAPNQDHRTAEEWAGTRCDDPWHEARKEQVIEANRLFHMVLRQAQAAYSAGLLYGPEACMEWLGNALRGPGQIPSEGSDPQWYSEDAWTDGPPWRAIPRPNATISEPWQPLRSTE